MQAVGVTLRGGHDTLRHEGETSGIEQGRDVPVVADGFRSRVDRCAGTVEDSYFISELIGCETVDFHAEIESRPDVRCDGVQRIRHDDRRGQRSRECRHHGFAQRRQVTVREGSLEFTDTYGKSFFHGHVDPCLLKDGSATGCCIDREVKRYLAPRFSRKSEYGIRYGKSRISQVVLVVSLVQAFVVVPIDVGRSLHQQVRFEHKVGFLRLDGEPFASGQGHHAVFAALFILCHGGKRKSRQ